MNPEPQTTTAFQELSSSISNQVQAQAGVIRSGGVNRSVNPLAALNLARNAGSMGSSYDPRGRGPLTAPRPSSGGSPVDMMNIPNKLPLTDISDATWGQQSHAFTSQVFEVAAWNPNADEHNYKTHLEPGDAVFVAPIMQSRVNGKLVEMFNVGQLNKILRDDTIKVMEDERMERETGKAGSTSRFLALLRKHGEDGLRLYHHHYYKGTLAFLGDKAKTLQEFYKLGVSDQFYCMTSFGVYQRWKFVGFVHTTSDPLRINGSQVLGYSRKLAVNVTVAGEIQRAINIWGGHAETDSQSHLHFVLRRAVQKDGMGAMEIIPWGSRERASIPRSLLKYEDRSGCCVSGRTYYVGYIQLPSNQPRVSVPAIYQSCGLIAGTHDRIREASARLPTVRIEVRRR